MAQPAEQALDFLSVALTPEFRDDPYQFFSLLREHEPVHHTPFGVYLVTRHADAAAIVRDPHLSTNQQNSELFQAFAEANPRSEENIDQMNDVVMLFKDPPDHTRLRGLVSKAFTPKMVERLRVRVQEIVDERLDAVEARGDGRMDVVTDLAYPLPVVIICELLGVPPEDHATFSAWSSELAASIDPDPLLSPDQQVRIEAAGNAFLEYFGDLIERRRRSLCDDLLSALIEAEEGGDRLSEEELLGTALFLLIAGHETTVNLIGNGTLALLQHRDQLERLRDDTSLDRHAVEELLRFDSPVQIVSRLVLEDVELAGTPVEAGEMVVGYLGAGNRDPERYAEPDRLCLDRADVAPLSFGGGIHYCLGAPLARLEARIALPTLLRRYPRLALADGAVRRNSLTLKGFLRLPIQTG